MPDTDCRLHPHRIRIGLQVLLLLPTIFVQPLQEVALPVEQSNSYERDIEIGASGLMCELSGKNSEAS